MADANLEKQLKIKLGSLKRLHKEYLSYVKEAETQQNKINKMKEESVDEYTVKKQTEVLEDTKQMIPNCKGRLQACHEDLTAWIEENGQDEGLKEQTDEAQEQLDTIKEFLESVNQTSSN